MARKSVGCTVTLAVLLLAVMAQTAQPAQPPASQPAAETAIHVMLIELKPGFWSRPVKEISEQMPELSATKDITDRLKEFGIPEVLSQPTVLVRWPQEAQIRVGERLPTVSSEGVVSYKDIGFWITLEGEWLQLDPSRAYLRANIDHSYFATQRDRNKADAPVRQQKLTIERIVVDGKTTWLTIPQEHRKAAGRVYLVGLRVYRLTPGEFQAAAAAAKRSAPGKQ